MEDNIDIEEHDLLNDPALRSVFPDLVILKREVTDFDISEETPIKIDIAKRNENYQLVSTLEVNSGNPHLVCSTQDLDVKPDILCTDIDDTLTVVKKISESEIENIKKESKVESNESPFYRNRIILGKINVDASDEEHEHGAPSDSNNIVNHEDKIYSEPDTAVVIKTDEDRNRIITRRYYEMDKWCQAKVLLTDCYPSLLHNKCYCAQCAILFPSTKAYSEHYMSTHPNSSKSTKASAALVEPKKFILTDDKPYQCSTCKKKFRYPSSLYKHKSIHTGERPFECTICKKTFRQRCNLNEHNIIHTGEKPYECTTCKKRFGRLRYLNSHKLIHTGEKPFECKTCEKTFRRRNDLNKHKLFHTGEKPFECTVCTKTFRERSTLNEHHLIHTGEKPFECKTCEKTFRRRNDLNQHKLIHTGEKPFECTVCTKTFRERSTLNKHHLIHAGEKPFECKTCEKTFRRRYDLNKHKLIHTGKMPFECTICTKTFRERSTLNKHHLIHAGEKIYECKTCEKTLRRRNDLNKHELIHKLNSSHYGRSGQSIPIYIDEHLPYSSKKLFYATRNFAKQYNFKYCWSSNGNIFLRKDHGLTAINIYSAKCLERLVPSQ